MLENRYIQGVVACFLFLLAALPASAEFYQYVDGNGITHFTDNISTVPLKYQSQLERHPEIFTPRQEDADLQPDEPETGTPDFFFEADDADVTNDESLAPESAKRAARSEVSKLTAERKILLDKKQELNKQFETLTAEQQALEKSRKDMKDEKDIIRYNTRVQEINEKIKAYKMEENRFISEIERYNELIQTPFKKSE